MTSVLGSPLFGVGSVYGGANVAWDSNWIPQGGAGEGSYKCAANATWDTKWLRQWGWGRARIPLDLLYHFYVIYHCSLLASINDEQHKYPSSSGAVWGGTPAPVKIKTYNCILICVVNAE